VDAVETLQRVGVRISADELDGMLARALAEMIPHPLPLNPRSQLSKADAEALERGGLSLEPLEDIGPDDPLMRTAALFAGLLASSLTVTQAAKILGVSTGRVRQELYGNLLYGIKDVGGWRLPRWQFDDEAAALLPGVRHVLSRLDRGIHPVVAYRWFTSPNIDLTVDDDEEVMLSPRDWLRSGYAPEAVAELAATLEVAP